MQEKGREEIVIERKQWYNLRNNLLKSGVRQKEKRQKEVRHKEEQV